MGDPVQSHPRLGRGPQTTTAAPILAAQNKKKKRAPSVPLASGPPSLPRGRAHQSPRALPSSLPSLPGAVCSARQINVKQGPNHPGLTAFTCDPHSDKQAQRSYCTCETLPFFRLIKASAAHPAPVSRRIPFPGDSGGGEHIKCITPLVSLFMPSLKRAQCFLSRPKWVKTTVLRSVPVEGNGPSTQRWKESPGAAKLSEEEVGLSVGQLGPRPDKLVGDGEEE
ncbi:unnamed protein product [Pleuronectes platessa]|uniref:Uncharacterized protein n=1 Tax=Pleuronectes platessa TaxID=8262 RepID=A0A9N7W024_PLEPL|nr:unnamed protein product [Pleuronectes platessa]